MARYILNSAVIPNPGTYHYMTISDVELRQWLYRDGWISMIGYEETAQALGMIAHMQIPVNRSIVWFEPGDEALIFRIKLPPGERRLAVEKKGRQGVEFVLRHAEMGMLRRES